jgi:hypothetical protein
MGLSRFPPIAALFTKSQIQLFTISLVVNDRHVVASEKVIECPGKKRLRVLAGLGLNKPEAAPKPVRQISADMNLAFPCGRSLRLRLFP